MITTAPRRTEWLNARERQRPLRRRTGNGTCPLVSRSLDAVDLVIRQTLGEVPMKRFTYAALLVVFATATASAQAPQQAPQSAPRQSGPAATS
jgi:hypothetical protein